MGSAYSSQSASGYNSSPPPDDGTTVAANKITWAKIKSAITDPIKTLADAVNSALRTALNVTPSTTSAAYTTVAGDHLTTIEATGSFTVSLGDAATMIAQSMGYQVTVRNKGTGTIKVTPITATDTLDGITAGYSTLAPGQAKTFGVAQSGVGYGTIGEAFTGDPGIVEFRLTLTTGTPVTTADVTAAGTLYCTPYKGNRISLYDGTGNWNTRFSAEFSLALTLTSGKPYDIFCYDNNGVPTLEVLVWTNDTTRATALALQNGVLVKSGATTRRYLGTLYSSGANTTEDSLAKRYLWNYYNRVARNGANTFSADRSTASATYVELNTEIRCQFVIGVAEDAVWAGLNGSFESSANDTVSAAIGFDGTAASAGFEMSHTISSGTFRSNPAISNWKMGLAVGFHYATVLALTAGGSTGTFHSSTGSGKAKVYLGIKVEA